MELNKNRIRKLGQRIAEKELTDRHRERTRAEYRRIFDVETTSESGQGNLDLIFARVIQARATPLSDARYRDLAEQKLLQEVIQQDTHAEAFELLYGTDDIGQKIANEMLRHLVDLFGINDEWRKDLDVALDTNVIQALVKTGAIELSDEEQGRDPARIVNTDPEADPNKLVSYQAVQESFNEAAAEYEFDPIVFDELWLEHREFINDPLLRDRSAFTDLLLE